jgi:hypothetical protein
LLDFSIISCIKIKHNNGYCLHSNVTCFGAFNVPLPGVYIYITKINVSMLIKSRRLRWAGHVARMGERRGAYRDLVGKPEGRRPLGRPRRRWEGNVKMYFR